MSRLTTFNSPFMLGFDHLENILNRLSKTSPDGYPPYNIEQIGEGALRITLAVAGFSMDNLNVSVEDNQLFIRGRAKEEGAERVFVHRGIAGRQFQRSFLLADGIEIKGAFLEDGLLNIDLFQKNPEPVVHTINIENGQPNAKGRSSSAKKTINVD
ncbi:MAG TPA: Hsp20 family protein [Rhodospirillales bacterium]|nr:Hsp20 family protein [Rhodospirillales bacterium]